MSSLQELEEEVRKLTTQICELQREVAALRQIGVLHGHPVEVLLSQRGLPVLAHGDRSQVILPVNVSAPQTLRFYQLMRRYSFRLFLRELLQAPRGSDLRSLNRYCSIKTVKAYLGVLSQMGVVRLDKPAGYALIRHHITSLGPTLEWYVAEVFQRDFLAPALFNVRLHNTRHGGDYDVIASIAGHLVYVEVKSSPPRGVELQAVSAFLSRLEDLQPDISLFLVDTELRMYDKMVPLFAQALEKLKGSLEPPPVVRLADEIFHIHHHVYIANSRRGIYTNLRLCLRDALQRGNKELMSSLA